MQTAIAVVDNLRTMSLQYIIKPALWGLWPFLPLVRGRPGSASDLGVMYDALQVSGVTGYTNTVFITNLYTMPRNQVDFLALPQERFDSVEALLNAGWRVD